MADHEGLMSPETHGMVQLAGGGVQHAEPYRFDLIDADAMFKMAVLLAEGARVYGEDNWRKIPCQEHVNRGIAHMYAWLGGDRSEEHLVNALCRAMMAVATESKVQHE